MHRLIGYFDGTAAKPTFDPGMDAPCITCGKPLARPVKTSSLALDGGARSYFYRQHKACAESLSEADADRLDSSIIDLAAKEEAEAHP